MSSLHEAIVRFLYIQLRLQGMGHDTAKRHLVETMDFDDVEWTHYLDELTRLLSARLDKNEEKKTKERN